MTTPYHPETFEVSLREESEMHHVYTVHTCPLDMPNLNSITISADRRTMTWRPAYPMSHETARFFEAVFKSLASTNPGADHHHRRGPCLEPFEVSSDTVNLVSSIYAQLRNKCFASAVPLEYEDGVWVRTVNTHTEEFTLMEFSTVGSEASLDRCVLPSSEMFLTGGRLTLVPCSILWSWPTAIALTKALRAVMDQAPTPHPHLVLFYEDPETVRNQVRVTDRGVWPLDDFFDNCPKPWCSALSRTQLLRNAFLSKMPSHEFTESDQRRRSHIVVMRTRQQFDSGLRCIKVYHVPVSKGLGSDRWEVTIVPTVRNNHQMKMCSQSIKRRVPYTEQPFVLEGDNICRETGISLLRHYTQESGVLPEARQDTTVVVKTVCKDTYLLNLTHRWDELPQMMPCASEDPVEKHPSMSHLLDGPVRSLELYRYHTSVFIPPYLCEAIGAYLMDVSNRVVQFSAECLRRDSGCYFSPVDRLDMLENSLTRRGRTAYVFFGSSPDQASELTVRQYMNMSIREVFIQEYTRSSWKTRELYEALLKREWDDERDEVPLVTINEHTEQDPPL